MSNLLPSSAINPISLATKLAAVANRNAPAMAEELERCPRLVEAVWFIQWRSIQPGGLRSLVADLMEHHSDHFVTRAMQEIGAPRGGVYTFKDMVTVWQSFPSEAWKREDGPHRARPDLVKLMVNGEQMIFQALKREGMDTELAQFFTPEFFHSVCVAEAESHLWDSLRKVCEEPMFTFANGETRWERGAHSPPPDFWYVRDLPAALFSMMDSHAEETKGRIALTAVVKTIWREMDFAMYARGLVTIEGDTRFGKTEAIRTWTDAYPGRMRYFAVPSDGRLATMHWALAVAFGLSYGAKTSEATIRNQINFVLQFGRIGIAADEGHFLLPTRNAEPRRLDWLRTQIVDKGTPCVVSLTPQFMAALSKFTKESSYNAAQWLGRSKRAVVLPDSLTEDDLVAVARMHLPGFTRAFLKRVAGKALQTDHLLAALQNVAVRARWIAQESGRDKWIAADVTQAMQDCLPSSMGAQDAPPEMEAEPPSATPSRNARPCIASLPPESSFLPLSRAVTPAIPADLAVTD